MPRFVSPLRWVVRGSLAAVLLLGVAPGMQGATTYKQPSFHETSVFTGLTNPTTVRFLPDGTVLVTEKSGLIKQFASLTATTPTVVADLRVQVHNFWDRGLMGLAVDPNYLTNHYVYILYSRDAPIGGVAPKWGPGDGTSDPCPTPPGATTDGCVISSHVSRLTAVGSDWTASEQVLIEDWCQQFPSHTADGLAFGADGKLYVSHGEGASFSNNDWGQFGGTIGTPPPTPKNPCGDPPVPVGGNQTPPTAEGGSLRAQSPRRALGEPRVLNGSVLRVDPATGAGVPGNPLFSSTDANERRIIAYGFRNPFRITIRPGTNDVWVADVGSGTWEEIDHIPDLTTARNYGWPCFEGPAVYFTGFNICPSQAQTIAPFFTYKHTDSVVVGDGCLTGSSAVAGMAFYQGASNYPASYNNAFFFSDYSRRCMWVMFPGGNGDPDPNTRAAFAASAQGPVDLQIGPDGNLYYVDFDGGKIWRVEYGPVAVASGSPTNGALPLTVNFSSAGSAAAQTGDTITFAWDLDGDGQFNDSTLANPSYTYTTAANVNVRLKVTDNHGAFNISSPVLIAAGNTPPTATISSPASSLTWKVGDIINFAGSASDPQQGQLPPSALSWSVIIHHCPSNCHTHIYQTFSGVASGSFPAPDHEYPSYLEIQLTATDSGGLTGTSSVNINPLTVNLTLQSVPSALQLTAGTTTAAAPFVKTVILNSQTGLIAPSPQGAYQFASWSDGGAQSHTITATTAATYTATYTNAGSSLPPPWLDQDIGSPGLAGSAGYSSGTFTVIGSGNDIESSSDQFHYVYQPVTGDVTVIARVATIQNTNAWAKGGVMIRETLVANSKHAMMVITPGNGLSFQRRLTTGGLTTHTAGALVAAPYWVKIVRTGNTLSGYSSSNGTTWTLVGSDTVTMAAAVYVGLPLTSHDNGILGTATFDNVSVAQANNPPTVSITSPVNGAVFTAPASITINATASDSDGTVSKVDFYQNGNLLGTDTTSPYSFSWTNVAAGSYTLTAVATDNLGKTGTSAPVNITVNTAGGSLPPPWLDQDIGSPGLAGSAGYSSGTFTVIGSGNDIESSSDQFHYVYQPVTGDATVIARVATIQNTNAWAKGGVMIRETLVANSKHAMMVITPGNGLSFQRRLTTGGLTTHTAGALVAAPYWVKIVRTGNTLSGYSSSNGTTWTLVGSDTVTMAAAVYVGLPLTSHDNGILGTATFDNVSVAQANNPPTVSITSPVNGAVFTAPASITINATASDSDGTVSKVDFYQNGNLLGTDTTSPYSFSWTNVAAGSYTLTAVATDNLGNTGTSAPVNITVNTAGGSLPPPWLDQDIGSPGLAGSAAYSSGTFTVKGSGNDIESSSDQFHYVYQPVTGDATVIARVATIQNTNAWAKGGVMIRETLAANSKHAMMVITPGNGLAFQRRLTTGGLTTHTPGALVAAPYWVKIVRSGNTLSGYASSNGTTWTLVGSDTVPMAAAVYVGLPLTSHNASVVCTATFDNVSVAQANNPPTVSITSPVNGAVFTAPASITINATASDSDGTVSKVDFYQNGNLLGTDTTSPYSFSWTNVAAGSYTLTAVATDNLNATGTSTPVSITVNTAGGSLPPPWLDQDIGSPGLAGSAAYSGGTFTVIGSGNDIESSSDQFHYVYQPVTGDATVIARVATIQNTNAWAKGGVMIRETLAANSKHAMMVITPGNGLAFQRRLTTGGLTVHTPGALVAAPYWVKIVRAGNTLSGYSSSNGTTWTLVGSDTVPMAASVYVGLPLTSHNAAAVCTATFSSVSVTTP